MYQVAVFLRLVFSTCFLFLLACQLGYSQELKKVETSSFAEGALRLSLVSSAMSGYGINSNLASELELVADQKKEVQSALNAYNEQTQKTVAKYSMESTAARENNDAEATKNARNIYEEEMARLVQSAEKKINSVLLPHQSKRLQQIGYQMSVSRKYNVKGIGMLVPLINELDISSSLRSPFLQDLKVLDCEFKKELEELRKKYVKRVWETAPDEIKQKIRENVGDLIFED